MSDPHPITCSVCGFVDQGTFCSNCGARLLTRKRSWLAQYYGEVFALRSLRAYWLCLMKWRLTVSTLADAHPEELPHPASFLVTTGAFCVALSVIGAGNVGGDISDSMRSAVGMTIGGELMSPRGAEEALRYVFDLIPLACVPLLVMPTVLLTPETLATRRIPAGRITAILLYWSGWYLPLLGVQVIASSVWENTIAAQIEELALSVWALHRLWVAYRDGFKLSRAETLSSWTFSSALSIGAFVAIMVTIFYLVMSFIGIHLMLSRA